MTVIYVSLFICILLIVACNGFCYYRDRGYYTKLSLGVSLVLLLAISGAYIVINKVTDTKTVQVMDLVDGKIEYKYLNDVWAPELGKTIFIPGVGFSLITEVVNSEITTALTLQLTNSDKMNLLGRVVESHDFKYPIGIVTGVDLEASVITIKLY